jgi:hypothetical protein
MPEMNEAYAFEGLDPEDREAFYEALEETQPKLHFNGVNGTTGAYGIPPKTGAAFAQEIVGGPREEVGELQIKKQVAAPLEPGKDPRKLDQAGWAVIFPAQLDDARRGAIKEALSELLAVRQAQAGDLYRVYEGAEGYRPGEDKDDFFNRLDISPGMAKPDEMPYYVLLAGSPEEIPYEFQYQLDVMRGVGRLHFDDLAAYARYARSVKLAEEGALRLPFAARFFGVRNPDDEATRLSSRFLVQRLYDALREETFVSVRDGETELPWDFGEAILEDRATKARLASLLTGPAPALLFTASHGMEFDITDPRQLRHQGALLCSDWPGPQRWRRDIPQDFYLSADDLPTDANLSGLIAVFFACYGAGTPRQDQFAARTFADDRPQIAPRNFLAPLPQKLLGQGALAVIGHVERAWGYSFISPGSKVQTRDFENLLKQLLQGDRIGWTTETLDMRYADLATQLSQDLEEFKYGSSSAPTAYELAERWTRNNDARGYVVLGDPAVQAPFGAPDAAPTERPDLGTISVPAAPAAGPEPTPTLRPGAAEAELGVFGGGEGDEGAGIWTTLNTLIGDMADKVNQGLKNITSLEVNTYTSDDLENVDYNPQTRTFTGSLKIRARTHIAFDGDMEVCLPMRDDGSVDRELWQVHREMVQEAQANRAEFLKIVADLAARVVNR